MPVCPHCETTASALYAPCPRGDGFFTVEEAAYTSFRGDPFLGQLIGQRFVVSGVIGHGSIGRVYKAHQLGIARTIALKIFKLEHLMDQRQGYQPTETIQAAREDAQDRFIREAQVLGQLTHPNCVTVYDFGGSQADGFMYIAMEHVAGITLRQAIQRGLRPDITLDIIRQILAALRQAHAVGIVHRDLKPENILMTFRQESQEPVVKVLDFGIAKLMGQRQDRTSAGMLFGTPAYMSPEQCRGDSDQVGAPSDVYALGCMVYELLCDKLPFQGKSPQQLLTLHQEAPVPALAPKPGLEVAAPLEGFVMTCLAKSPAQRYPTARAALVAFDEALEASSLPLQSASRHLRARTSEALRVPQSLATRVAAEQGEEGLEEPGAPPVVRAAPGVTLAGAGHRRGAPASGAHTVIGAPLSAEDAPGASQRNLMVGAALVIVLCFCALLFFFFFKAL